MRVTIIADDSKVGVDGEFRVVDLTGLDRTIHAVQWDSVLGKGDVEYRKPRRNKKITDFSPYQVLVDLWNAVPPPPAPPPDMTLEFDPGDELDAALTALDPATATVGDLIAVLRGQRGKKGRVAGRPV